MSGLSAARACQASGAHVTVTDDRTLRTDLPFPSLSMDDLLARNTLAPFTHLVLSPSIIPTGPRTHPLVSKGKNEALHITSDVDLFFQSAPAGKIIGISGTNGKSSTASLIHHVLKSTGHECALGGNIGTPVLDLPKLSASGIYVLELSSYQLEITPHLALDIALMLPITPDHLARYGTMDAYAAAKQKLFHHQKKGGLCLYDAHDPWHRRFVQSIEQHRKCLPYSPDKNNDEALSLKGTLMDQCAHIAHNILLSAFSALRSLGLSGATILKAAGTWPGLPHRREHIHTTSSDLAHLLFINDSKATNTESAAFSLAQSAEHNIFWICGGQLKKGTNFDLFLPHLSHVKHAFPIGEGAQDFAHFFEKQGVSHTPCKTLDEAFTAAIEEVTRTSAKGACILLAPGGASFDHYKNFEARGAHFRQCIKDLRPRTSKN